MVIKNCSEQKNIVILTGAGISQESGLATFRDFSEGLWHQYRIEEVASLEGFDRNPNLVHEFYNRRKRQLDDPAIKPNNAHIALAKLEQQWAGRGLFTIITQNVDDLHERAGSRSILHMHGELRKVRCVRTERVFPCATDLSTISVCPCCNTRGNLRPHIVWFGEKPLEIEMTYMHLLNAHFFVSIGTSGNVYPAADFVNRVQEGCETIEVNLGTTEISHKFSNHYQGPATEVVPKVVEYLLKKLQAGK